MSLLKPRLSNFHIIRSLRSLKKGSSENTPRSLLGYGQPILPLKEDDLQQLADEPITFDTKTLNDVSIIDSSVEPSLPSKPQIMDISSIKKNKGSGSKSLLSFPLSIDNQYEKISEVVTPLSKFPYQRQLKMKEKHFEDVLRSFKSKLKSVEAPFVPRIGKLPCTVENIVPSPDLVSYRNKDEFSVHMGVDGNSKTVGFFYGSPKDPEMRCVPPQHLVNIKDQHKLIAKHFQSYIRSSPHPACLNFTDGGVWRHIIVRSNSRGEAMLIAVVYPKQLDFHSKEELKLDIRRYFTSGPGAECGVNSIFLQACMYSKCNPKEAPFELIHGSPFLEEECAGIRFRISPDTYFQVNGEMADLLYHNVEKLLDLSPLSTVLDICCGTGIASILFSAKCRGAVGVDLSPTSIANAKENARLNGCTNANFIEGKAEEVLPELTGELQNSTEVVALVNSSRAGLHPSTVDSIRACEAIRRVVLVTSRPEGMVMNNMVSLCSSLKPKFSRLSDLGPPFAVHYAVPLDMYPSTLQSEYVFLFERS